MVQPLPDHPDNLGLHDLSRICQTVLKDHSRLVASCGVATALTSDSPSQQRSALKKMKAAALGVPNFDRVDTYRGRALNKHQIAAA